MPIPLWAATGGLFSLENVGGREEGVGEEGDIQTRREDLIRDHVSILEPLKRSRVSNVIIAHDKSCTSRLGGREKISRASGREREKGREKGKPQ